MKKNILLYTLILAFSASLVAQNRSGDFTIIYKNQIPISKTESPVHTSGDRGQYGAFSYPAISKYSPETLDTLNYPLEGTYALYIFPGGYVSGNNSFGDKAKANKFGYPAGCVLKGVLIDFARATSGDVNIEIAAWNNEGDQNTPGSKIASTFISLDDIFIDVLNDQTTYVEFENPVVMTPTFYVGAILPTGVDTVAIYTNEDGDTDPATAWEKWSDGQWVPYDDEASWGFKMSHAIFPIIDTDVALTANFTASDMAINPGTTVDFTDTSIGGPISWSWSFEGGTPDISTEQNPAIIYNEEGLFEVTLVVGDGETYDTLTKTDLIWVSDEITIETDTLNYPLEGTYTVYEIIDGGYICGNNLFHDLAKANYFNISQDVKITGLLVDFVLATGGNPSIDLLIWNNNGTGGGPGSALATQSVELNTIESNIANNVMTYVPINPPISINHPFYGGFNLPTAPGDTLVVWSNEFGDTSPGTAWDKWEDGIWVPISDPSSWGEDLAMAIHPIVEYQTGIHDLTATVPIQAFPNPTNGLMQINFASVEDAFELELLNLDGTTIKLVTVPAGITNLTLDLTTLPGGVYFIRVTGEKTRGIQKIIIN